MVTRSAATWSRPGRRSRRAGAASARSPCSTRRRSRPGSPPRPRASTSATTSTTPTAGKSTAGTPSSPSPPRRWRSTTRAWPTPATLDRARFGVYLGSGEGQQDFPRFVGSSIRRPARTGRSTRRRSPARASNLLHPIHEAEQEPGTPPGTSPASSAPRGPNANCLTACAASSQAIGEAAEIIRRGDADVMLSGGTHSMIHPFGVTGFNLLTALSTRNDEPTRASRPFDRDRDGFILGEGAGMLILEELEHAKARGATIHGEVAGYGSTADAFRLTDTHDEGRGAIACMREALADAGLDPERRRLHQRPRDQHVGQRLDRDPGDQADVRRRRRTRCRSPAPRA